MRSFLLLYRMSLAGMLAWASGCAVESGTERVPIDEPIPLVSQLPEPITTAPADTTDTQPAPTEPKKPPPFRYRFSIDGRDIVRLAEITVYLNGRAWPYRFLPSESTDTVWEDILHVGYLRPDQDDDRLPVMKCWTLRDVEKNTRSIVVTTSDRLPEMRIRLEPAEGLFPVRMRPDEVRPRYQSSVAPPGLQTYDAFFDPLANSVYELQGRLHHEVVPNIGPEPGGTRMLYLDVVEPDERRLPILTVAAHQGVVTDRNALPTPSPTTQPFSPLETWRVAPGTIEAHLPTLPEPLAGWTDALLRGGDRSERLARNMHFTAAQFDRRQADAVWTRSLRSSQKAMLTDHQLRDGEEVLPVLRDAAWMQGVREAGAAWQRINDHAPDYNAQHMLEYAEICVRDYPGYGVTHANAAPPLLIDEPLTIEHARMLVTLMGLSGRPVILGDELTGLSMERMAMLGRILPPQPMRSADLFEGQLPEVWHADVGSPPAMRHLVGLFNWSPRRQSRTVTLAGLGLPTDEQIAWAVYDIWQERVIAIVHERFPIILPPTSCRLVCLAPMTDRPILLGDPNHITLNPASLEVAVAESDGAVIWTGTTHVRSGTPRSLTWIVPPGLHGFDVTKIRCEPGDGTLVADGPLRRVIFHSDTTAKLSWQIEFGLSSLVPDAPPAPSQLAAQQNTRGVHLSWVDMHDKAARYRVYRNGDPIADVPGHVHNYQDSDVVYNHTYRYEVTSINWADLESVPSREVHHRTPVPISTNLTRLVPLWVEQKHLTLREDRSVGGNGIRMAGRRYYHGLGTHSTSRIAYFLGEGYDVFSGHVGIDDETRGKGSAIFEVVLDGETVFTSRLLRGNDIPESFSISVAGGRLLELVTLPTDDGEDHDHADWGNPYLHVLDSPLSYEPPIFRRDAGGDEYTPLESED